MRTFFLLIGIYEAVWGGEADSIQMGAISIAVAGVISLIQIGDALKERDSPNEVLARLINKMMGWK